MKKAGFFVVFLFIASISWSQTSVRLVHGIDLPKFFVGQITEMVGFRTTKSGTIILTALAFGAEFFVESIKNPNNISVPFNKYEDDFLTACFLADFDISKIKPTGKRLMIQAIKDYILDIVKTAYNITKKYNYIDPRIMQQQLYELDYALFCYLIIEHEDVSDMIKDITFQQYEELYNMTGINSFLDVEIKVKIMIELDEVLKKMVVDD